MKAFLFFSFFPILAFSIVLPKLKVETYNLSNGLKVILYEDHTVPIVTVNVNYQVGSKNEQPGKTGYAHLFEHIMFQGSEHFNDDFFKALQDIGGEVNGATSQDRTRYYENVPSSFLERALWLEADRMGFLLPALTEERLKNQIDVVRNERRQNYDDAPYGLAYEEILKILYPPDHPYSWPTIGFHEDLKNAKIEDMVEFFKKYYVPSNSSICVGGDFDIEEAKKLIDKYFSSIPPGKPLSYIKKWVPEFNSVKRKVLKDKVQFQRIYMVWHTVPIYEEFDAEMDIFAKILGEGISSPLYQKLVKEKEIATEVQVYHISGEISGYFEIVVTLREGKEAFEAEKETLKTLKEILSKPLDEDLFLASKMSYVKEFVDSMKRIGGFGGICDRLNAYYHYLGKPDMFQWDLDRYLNATPENTLKAAKKFLEKPYGILTVEPIGELKSKEEVLNRNIMPQGKKEIYFSFNNIEKFKLSNGIEVFSYYYDKVPVDIILLIFDAGAVYEDEKLYGISNALSNFLMRGTKEKSGEEIEKILKKLGGEIDSYNSMDTINIKLSILKENFDKGLVLLKEIIKEPVFLEKEWKILKEELISKIIRQKDSLSSIASFGIFKNLFKNHPYGHHYLGEVEKLKEMKREDIVNFYENFITPSNLKIIYIGALRGNDLKEKMKIFEDLKEKKVEKREIKRPEIPEKLEFCLIDKPKSAQSFITLSIFSPSPEDKDYPAFLIGNHLIGGYFLSRINLKLREEKGFTYGARSSIFQLKNGSFFNLRTPVDIKYTADALKEIFNEFDSILSDNPVSEEEFEKAKNNLILSLPSRYESPDSLLYFIETIVNFNLPLSYLKDFPEILKNVRIEDVQKAIERYFKNKNFLLIVVTDKEKVLEKLKELNFEKINFCDQFGNPLKD